MKIFYIKDVSDSVVAKLADLPIIVKDVVPIEGKKTSDITLIVDDDHVKEHIEFYKENGIYNDNIVVDLRVRYNRQFSSNKSFYEDIMTGKLRRRKGLFARFIKAS